MNTVINYRMLTVARTIRRRRLSIYVLIVARTYSKARIAARRQDMYIAMNVTELNQQGLMKRNRSDIMHGKKYYWLKLHRDFFKRHDIKIVEAMPNGKDYVLLYLKLLLESVDHEGRLRFSETIPYDEQMIAIITNTNIDTVRAAMVIFQKLNLVDVLDDQTIFLQEAEKLLGSEGWSAERTRRYRERQENLTIASHSDSRVTSCDEEIEIEKEIEIDKENKANKSPKNTFKKPTVDEILKYCGERNNLVDPVRFFDFYESKGWMIGKTKMKDWKAAVRTWEKGESTKSNPGPKKTAGGTYKL